MIEKIRELCEAHRDGFFFCFCSAFLDDRQTAEGTVHQLIIRKDLLDDSNAAKDEVGSIFLNLCRHLLMN